MKPKTPWLAIMDTVKYGTEQQWWKHKTCYTGKNNNCCSDHGFRKGPIFPYGDCIKGPAEDFTFDIFDFKIKKIPLDNTVGQMYEEFKPKLLRFYICPKRALQPITPNLEKMSCLKLDVTR